MPERSRIFARARPSLGDALAAHPILGPNVYLLPYGPEHPYAPPPRGLIAVTVPDVLWRPAAAMRVIGEGVLSIGSDGPTEAQRAAVSAPSLWPLDEVEPTLVDTLLAHEPTLARFPWIRDVVPDRRVLAWVRALGRQHRVPIAWYHLLERGDDLYYDLALVFEEGRERLLLHSTILASADDAGRISLDAHGFDEPPRFEFVLQEVWRTLGADGLGYFPPDDEARFDWGAHRVAPAPGAITDAELAELGDEHHIAAIEEGSDARYLGRVGLLRHWPGFRRGGLDGYLSEDSRFYVRSIDDRAYALFRQFTSSEYKASPEDVVAGWVASEREWELFHWVDDMNVHIQTLLIRG